MALPISARPACACWTVSASSRLVAAAEAIADAGTLFERDDRDTTGVFVGTGMGGAQSTDEGYQAVYEEQSERVKPYTVLMAMNNAAAAWIGIDHHLLGPNLTLFECLLFVGRRDRRSAGSALRRERLDVMIAGGSEAPLTFGTLKAWAALKTLATEDPDDASASCKPFAKNRSGFVLGEGAAMIVLESWDRAMDRGAHIHARACGLWPQHGRGAHYAADRGRPGARHGTVRWRARAYPPATWAMSTLTARQRWRTMPWRLRRSNRFSVRGACVAGQFDQVHARASARRGRRTGARGDRARDREARASANDAPRACRSGM